ncbi:MAG: hypothetical protein A2498_07090 [Lentisphaerae bacterium RIFOXYC12_FULL_60_16]|nr:MAG: hypothetical protein A2498_07090 [Lentisphaerae bacterium RIFOXYC12_FULL_60_16]OGV72498.1 MAG: hypothetical protein A2269_01290 [Lentisphaerae bacterium RIFOXYA12_FULL_60_10]OGV78928.1 MAG: hypothetical protein A2340_03265 [Lentisphaerae bacterium RIFOXYB12_FULL_60_10]
MTMDIEQLRRGLRNPDARSRTIDAALDAGPACIDSLVVLLNDRNESVRWSAIRILSEVGDGRAVGPLINLLESGKNLTEAVRALQNITGQDHGDDAGAWRQWAVSARTPGISIDSHRLGDRDLLTAATRDLPVRISGQGPQYSADVNLPDGRSQQVWVDFSGHDNFGNPVVQLCTPCGKADPARYEWALKLNLSIPCGAIGLAELDGFLCFAVVETHLRSTVHPEDMAKSITTLAEQGDSMEKMLTGQNRY